MFCFAIIAKPLFYLLREDVEFFWGPNQAKLMEVLKYKITTAPALAALDYESGRMVYLGVDASAEGGGAVIE